MGVPGKINIEGWYCDHFTSVGSPDKDKKSIVLGEQSSHCESGGWRVDPIDLVHLFNKRTLSDHGPYQVKRKRGRVSPVA